MSILCIHDPAHQESIHRLGAKLGPPIEWSRHLLWLKRGQQRSHADGQGFVWDVSCHMHALTSSSSPSAWFRLPRGKFFWNPGLDLELLCVWKSGLKRKVNIIKIKVDLDSQNVQISWEYTGIVLKGREWALRDERRHERYSGSWQEQSRVATSNSNWKPDLAVLDMNTHFNKTLDTPRSAHDGIGYFGRGWSKKEMEMVRKAAKWTHLLYTHSAISRSDGFPWAPSFKPYENTPPVTVFHSELRDIFEPDNACGWQIWWNQL